MDTVLNKELTLECGCIVGERYCPEALRILNSDKSRPRGRHGKQQHYSDAQLKYFDHISKGVKPNETI